MINNLAFFFTLSKYHQEKKLEFICPSTPTYPKQFDKGSEKTMLRKHMNSISLTFSFSFHSVKQTQVDLQIINRNPERQKAFAIFHHWYRRRKVSWDITNKIRSMEPQGLQVSATVCQQYWKYLFFCKIMYWILANSTRSSNFLKTNSTSINLPKTSPLFEISTQRIQLRSKSIFKDFGPPLLPGKPSCITFFFRMHWSHAQRQTHNQIRNTWTKPFQ